MTFALSSFAITLLYLVAIGCVFWLFWWAIEKIVLPEPFMKIAKVILVVASVLVALNFLLSLFGHSFIQLR